jgi:hypothetical protein
MKRSSKTLERRSRSCSGISSTYAGRWVDQAIVLDRWGVALSATDAHQPSIIPKRVDCRVRKEQSSWSCSIFRRDEDAAVHVISRALVRIICPSVDGPGLMPAARAVLAAVLAHPLTPQLAPLAVLLALPALALLAAGPAYRAGLAFARMVFNFWSWASSPRERERDDGRKLRKKGRTRAAAPAANGAPNGHAIPPGASSPVRGQSARGANHGVQRRRAR